MSTNTQPLETSITAVTVFNDQARVTRSGSISLEVGEHSLTLSDVPRSLIGESVRAKGQGAGVTLLGVDVVSTYLAELPEDDIRALQDQLDVLREQDSILEDEDRVLYQRLDWLNNISGYSPDSFSKALANGRTSLDALSALSDYIAGSTLNTQDRRRAIKAERDELKKQIDALQRQLDQARGSHSTSRYDIRVDVQVDAPIELALEVEYGVYGAGWQPIYDLRLDGAELWLTYMARVSQNTGEDWPETSLLLSTARPGAGASLPELRPWYINPMYPPATKAAFMALPGVGRQPAPQARMARSLGGEMKDEEFDELPMWLSDSEVEEQQQAPQATPEAPIAQASIESGGGGAVTYRITRPVAVPSDGTPHNTTVTIQQMQVALDYLTIPKLAEEAYLRATVTNTSEYILLPGSVSLFRGADFVGRTHIKTVAPGEEFKAMLGVDDRIRIELTNLTDGPAKITLQDQIPLGSHEQIKAKLISATPQPTDQDKLNVLTWDMELAQGEKREVIFSFSVEYPRHMNITGLGV